MGDGKESEWVRGNESMRLSGGDSGRKNDIR